MALTEIPKELSSTPGIVDNSNATAITIDASENVGIGTTSPNNRIDAVEAQGTVANVLANGTYVAKFTGNTTYTTGASQGILIGGVDGSLRGVALVAESQSVLNDHDFIIAVSGTSATPTERMRIDTNGNVGIGVVPSTVWSSSYDALQIGLGGSVYAHDGAGSSMSMAANVVYEGLSPNFYDKYLTSSTASKYIQDSGLHIWSTAASGTAGNNITWSEAMRIDASGNLALGHTTTTGAKFAICDGANAQVQFFPEISTDTNLTQHYDPTAIAYMTSETRAASHSWKIGTDLKMTLDASGNVGIGVSVPTMPLDVAGACSDGGNTGANVNQTLYDTTSYALGVGGGIGFAGKAGSGSNLFDVMFATINGIKENANNADYSSALTFKTRVSGSGLTERMRIDSSGNLLVGRTAATSAKLHLENATDVHMDMNSTGDNRGKLGSKVNDLYIGHSSSAANIIFKKNIGSDDHPADSGDETMRIDSSGLNVTGSVTADGLTLDGNDSYTANIKFDYGASGPTYFSNFGYKSNSDGNKVFLTITDGGIVRDVLVANYDGRVGIGTDTPAVKLDVTSDAASRIATFWDGGSDGTAMSNGAAVLGISRISDGVTALHGPVFEVGRDNSTSTSYNVDQTLFSVHSDKIIAGNNIEFADGKGIDFSASSNTLGMTSELLSDYEEGTWTPVVSTSAGTLGAVSGETGTYTRIGRQVTLWWNFNITDLGTGSGVVFISNASKPFSHSTSISYYIGINRPRSGTSSICELDTTGAIYMYGSTIGPSFHTGSITYNVA